MSKGLSKSYIFFKNLYRPGVITPPKDKKLTIVHKVLVSIALKPRKVRDIPDTIDYFEWDHVKSRLRFKMYCASFIIVPVLSWFVISKPIMELQDRWMEKAELKKYGESRENDTTFSRWF